MQWSYNNKWRKRTSYLIILACFILPKWWLIGNLKNFQQWYPKIGILAYCFSKLLIVLGIVSFISIYWSYKNTFKSVAHKVVLLFKTLFDFILQDVYPRRVYTINTFLRLLAIIYVIAFGSLLWQFSLVSENGLIPYKEFAEKTFTHEGYSAIFIYPSIFWLSQANWFIYLILSLACVVSLLCIFSNPKTISYFFLWFCYLSIVIFGRDLFQFPWDTFLLEIGFLSIFAVYFIQQENQLPRLILLTFLLLFFRQWFSMGMTKLIYSDTSWHSFSYMKYYWLNQPSPTPVSWYMYQLPMWIQRLFTAFALVGEITIPIIMLFGRRGRIIAFTLSLILSLGIQLNGNFGFFNMLTAILGILCLDDNFFNRESTTIHSNIMKSKTHFRIICMSFVTIVFSFNLFYTSLWLCDSRTQKHPANFLNYYFDNSNIHDSYINEIGGVITKYRIVSPHGVFKGIPHKRIHIEIIAQSENGKERKLSFARGSDILNFSFSAPIMERLPFNFYYQSVGSDFYSALKINSNSKYLNTWAKNLIEKIFQGDKQLMNTEGNEKIKLIKIYQKQLAVDNKYPPYSINNPKNFLIDSITIYPIDSFKTPLFSLSETRKYIAL